MPGIASVQRCARCKRRKIKCDQNWPTCSPCVRADVTCSGPPVARTTFVVYNPRQARRLSASTRSHSPTPFSETQLEDDTDRLVLRLGECLKSSHGTGFYILGCQCYLFPKRLRNSQALRDAAHFLCSVWETHRRDQDRWEGQIDYVAYGRALRSIQRAVDDKDQQCSAETIAAVLTMELIEMIFQRGTSTRFFAHLVGLGALLRKKGPPVLQDDLDCFVGLETVRILMILRLNEQMSDLHEAEAWKEAFEMALAHRPAHIPASRLTSLRVHINMSWWPTLVVEMRRLLLDPSFARAAALQEQARQIRSDFRKVGHSVLEQQQQNYEDSLDGPEEFRTAAEIEILRCTLNYNSLNIALHRILIRLGQIMGEDVEDLQSETSLIARQICSCIPQMRSLGKLTSSIGASAFCLAYQHVGTGDRQEVIDLMHFADTWSSRMPKSLAELEEKMARVANTLSGLQSVGSSAYAMTNRTNCKDGDVDPESGYFECIRRTEIAA